MTAGGPILVNAYRVRAFEVISAPILKSRARGTCFLGAALGNMSRVCPLGLRVPLRPTMIFDHSQHHNDKEERLLPCPIEVDPRE